MEDSVLKGTCIEDLSTHYQDVIKQYLKYARHRTELHIKEVTGAFNQIKDSRLLDENYSQQEVNDILNDLSTMVNSSVKDESLNIMQTNVELLRQIFEEADLCGLTVNVDVSSIEAEEAIQKIVSLEDKLFPKTTPKSKLPSIQKIEAVTAEEGIKFKLENESLREKLSSMQKHHTSMMTEKSELTEQLHASKDLITHLQESNEQLKLKIQRLLVNQEETEKLMSSSIESAASEKDANVSKILEENKKLQDELEAKTRELKEKEKELTSKINDTTQFKNMKKILVTKNDVIKDLRGKLAKFEQEKGDE